MKSKAIRKATIILAALTVCFGAALVGLAVSPAADASTEQNKVKKVALFEIIPLKIIDDLYKGFKKTMARNGFVAGKNVSYKNFNAQGQTTNCNTIAQQLAQQDWDMVYIVGTSCVQAMYQKRPKFPVLFGAMTDPVGAGMATSLARPKPNSTGTTDWVPPDKFLSVLMKLVPTVKTVGTISNPTEANSVSFVDRLRSSAKSLGLKVISVPVRSTNDVQTAAQALVGRVDAIIAPPDNTVEPAIGAVIKVARDNKLPLVGSKTESAKQGALLGMGVDYYQLGLINGVQGAKILKGTKPETLPVQGLEFPITAINITVAKALGLKVPPSLLKTKNVKVVR